MPDGSQRLFDANVRRRIQLEQLSANQTRDMLGFLSQLERDIVGKLANLPEGRIAARKAQERFLEDLRDLYKEAYSGLTSEMRGGLRDLAGAEAKRQGDLLEDALGGGADVTVSVQRLTGSAAYTIATSTPMQGRFLRDYWNDLTPAHRKRMEAALRIGFAEGESLSATKRRIRQVTQVNARGAETLIRTANSHIAAQVQAASALQNEDLIDYEIWRTVLDSRTSAVCLNLSGQKFKVGEGPYPPQHFRCRSVRSPVLKGSKPPKQETYPEWIERQPADVQDEVLGKAKAKAYRSGREKIQAFTPKGAPRSLERPAAASRASANSIGPMDLNSAVTRVFETGVEPGPIAVLKDISSGPFDVATEFAAAKSASDLTKAIARNAVKAETWLRRGFEDAGSAVRNAAILREAAFLHRLMLSVEQRSGVVRGSELHKELMQRLGGAKGREWTSIADEVVPGLRAALEEAADGDVAFIKRSASGYLKLADDSAREAKFGGLPQVVLQSRSSNSAIRKMQRDQSRSRLPTAASKKDAEAELAQAAAKSRRAERFQALDPILPPDQPMANAAFYLDGARHQEFSHFLIDNAFNVGAGRSSGLIERQWHSFLTVLDELQTGSMVKGKSTGAKVLGELLNGTDSASWRYALEYLFPGLVDDFSMVADGGMVATARPGFSLVKALRDYRKETGAKLDLKLGRRISAAESRGLHDTMRGQINARK